MINKKILLAITTYAGDLEQRLILQKVVRHIRYKNGQDIFLLIVSDGYIKDKRIHALSDLVLERSGPTDLQWGELKSIQQIIKFAKAHQFRSVIKSAGDVIMTESEWAKKVMCVFDNKKIKLLSTHWNDDNSWIVGTKFFVGNIDFLIKTFPKSLKDEYLENAFTSSISKHFNIKENVYLINTTTGYRHEVRNQLKRWGWEHSHRINNFIYIDEYSSLKEKWVSKLIIYPAFIFRREMIRFYRKFIKLKVT